MADHLEPNQQFDNAARAYELETARLTALADAQQKAIESASIAEKVVEQQLGNVRLGFTIAEYMRAIRQFRLDEKRMRAEAERIRNAGRSLMLYNDAHKLDGVSRQKVWAAFRILQRLAPSSVMRTWVDTELVGAMCWARSGWSFKTVGGQNWNPMSGEFPEPRDTASAMSLLGFQLDHHEKCTAKWGSYPYLRTIEALQVLAASFAGEVNRIEKEIESIRKGTYEMWNTADLVKLTSPAFR